MALFHVHFHDQGKIIITGQVISVLAVRTPAQRHGQADTEPEQDKEDGKA